MLDTRDCVTQFSGRVVVQSDCLMVANENGCETSLVLRTGMTFVYEDDMLRINGKRWLCTLYEERIPGLVLLV